jgi:hypothetical protein
MKQKVLFFLLAVITALSSQAQIGGGYDLAMNFGGAGTKVNEMRYDANGNLFFIARVWGKNVFAGTQIDPGAYFSNPQQEIIYGKIAPNGTQTLIKRISGGGEGRLDADGNLYMILTAGFPTAPIDYGNGIINDTNGAKLLKISNTGVAQWMKNIDTGSDVLSGTTGKPIINIQGMQFTPDGNLFAIIASNNPSPTPPTPQFTHPTRIIKYDANGDKVWHKDVFSSGTNGTITVPKTFVDDAGRLTFSIYSTTNQFYYNGEAIASQMGVYSFGQSAYSIIISLNADGSKKSVIADTGTNATTTFLGLNPINGNLYINYAVFANAKSTVAPFNNFPFLQTSAPFSGGGTLVFNSSGQFLNYLTGVNSAPPLTTMVRNGNKFAAPIGVGANGVYERGDYIFNSTTDYSVIEFLDQDFNFVKALKVPITSSVALHQDKASITGEFKTNLTFGSTTLMASYNDTDFATRFPVFASLKTDMFIAVADAAVIAPPTPANWLGVDNNWNNTANWSSGVVPDASTIVRFNTTTAQMPTVVTTPTVLRVIIDNGVTASLPSALVIKNKLIINGTLQVNHTGTLNFTNYSATAIEGTGTLAFNGTGTSSVNAFSLIGFKDLSLSTNENITLTGIYKNITFTGTNAIITASAGIEITNPDVNALTGYSATNYISGPITRAVNSNGTYVFPNAQFNYLKPEPTTITLNNITGTSKITVANANGVGTPNLTFATGTTTSVLGDYFWRITSDVAPTGGTYDVSFSKSVFSNGVTDANRYVVINRIATGNPWNFDGTKIISAQTGGTTSGSTVSNATVTAGLTGLTKFAEFAIGRNSTPVTDGTTVSTSTWTGNINTTWNNTGNWSNGVPNGTINAVIPSGLTNYPLVYTASDNAKSLTVNSGLTGFKLHSGLILTNGLIANSTTEITKLAGFNTAFNGYPGGISGSGKIKFETTNGIISANIGVLNNDIEINIGNTNSINLVGKIGGNINIISGLVNANTTNSQNLELTNPMSTLTATAPINHVAGVIYKTVNNNSTSQFIIGDINWVSSGNRKYGEINIKNNNIAAASIFTTWFSSGSTEPVSILDGTDAYTSFINSGQWTINPSVTSSTGTIDLTLKTSNYTNGRLSATDYVLLRRDNVSNPKWVIVPSALITEIGGVITATANGIAPFSANSVKFCIGLKATTTTWTGAAGTANWNTASNWSNGVPTAEVKAVIGNVTSGRLYPNNAPTSGSAAAAIEIASGSTLTLPSSFYTPNGIINNGTINISGSGIFYGFGSGSSFSNLTGTGKLVFGNSAPTSFDSYYMNQIVNNNIEVNNPAGLSLTRTTTFTGNVTLTNGVVVLPDYQDFIMNNPDATITGSTTAYIKGNLKRTVNANGTINFPIGNTGIYAPASLALNGLVGTTTITANFSTTAISGQPSNLTIGTNTVNSLLTGGSWFITPNSQPSAGSYTATLSAPIGSSTSTNFYVLKRADNYSFYPWTNLGTNVASSITAGVVTASASGLTSFSQFGIGEGITILPVKLINFIAKADAKTSNLAWQTASELNNEKFIIERADDSGNFISIGEVKGNGNSNSILSYSFKDFDPQNGNNYYRLKQVDFNGKFEYSDMKVINFSLNQVEVSFYPNPATDFINFSNSVNIKEIKIFNTAGKLMVSKTSDLDRIKITDEFNSGLYFIHIQLNNAEVKTSKVIIYK